jgi:hypothetical protein
MRISSYYLSLLYNTREINIAWLFISSIPVPHMSSTKLDHYLAPDEELLLSFSAESVDRNGESDNDNSLSDIIENSSNDSEYQFGATDRRVVYLTDSGNFKDIDFNHISSIESGMEDDYSEHGPGLAVGCCGGVLVLTGFVSIADTAGIALVELLIGGLLLAGAVKLLQNANTSEKQKIKFITGDEKHQQIEITLTPDSKENIGAELSRILRE